VKDAIEEFPAAPVETNSEGEEPEQELTVEPLKRLVNEYKSS